MSETVTISKEYFDYLKSLEEKEKQSELYNSVKRSIDDLEKGRFKVETF